MLGAVENMEATPVAFGSPWRDLVHLLTIG